MLIKEDIEQLGSLLDIKLEKLKEELKQEIRASQKDTIETLSELIHESYTLHEKRIKDLEEHTGLPHKN